MSIHARLKQLNIQLPAAPRPVAAYIPFIRTGNLIYISGQVPFREGKVPPEYLGPVPSKVSIETAAHAARQCALNALAILDDAARHSAGGGGGGGLDDVVQIVRLGVFICCDAGFTDQPKVANGASELLVDIFGESGRHARAAVGNIALPLGVCVEVNMIAEVK